MTASSRASRPPNIVVFMTDQQSGATVLPGARARALTPHLDELREEGVAFGRCLSVAPHCCPSRASFLTGRYPSEHGVWNNVNVANALSRGLTSGVPLWSTQLHEAGYRLGFAGKWHVSNTESPADHHWEEQLVTSRPRSRVGASEHEQARQARLADLVPTAHEPTAAERHEGTVLRPGYPSYRHYGTDENPFGDRDVVDSAMSFLGEVAGGEQPWVLYVGTLGPHDPYRPPARFLDLYPPESVELPASFIDPMADKPALYERTRRRFDQLTEAEHRETLRHYLAFCTYEDQLFGRLREAVDRAGAAEDTIFVYTSDHGDYMGEHGLWCKGLPSFEGAVHVPLVIGGARITDAGTTVASPVSIVDAAATIVDLCGGDVEGLSGRPLLDGDGRVARTLPDAVFTQTNGNELYGIQRTVVTNEWKLVMNGFDHDELYHRPTDPHEMTNLLHHAPGGRQLGRDPVSEVPDALQAVVRRLYEMLWRHSLQHEDNLTDDYIMTALASYGPGVAAPTSQQE